MTSTLNYRFVSPSLLFLIFDEGGVTRESVTHVSVGGINDNAFITKTLYGYIFIIHTYVLHLYISIHI